jgi:hypothetical protein
MAMPIRFEQERSTEPRAAAGRDRATQFDFSFAKITPRDFA